MRDHRDELYRYIIDKRIRTSAQMNAALQYFRRSATFDPDTFERETGVGVTITREQIEQAINTVVEEHRVELSEQRYKAAGKYLSLLMNSLKWADGSTVSTMYADRIARLLGPKTEQDLVPLKKSAATSTAGTTACGKDNKIPPAALKVASALAATTTKMRE
uniref:Glutamine--tRNA ligase n=1 Tax=Lygus hesperus TaxID=30085 RepID=A0A0A9YJG1_LYGHE